MMPTPLTCDAALDRLQDRLDGVSAPADAALTEHLAGCALCRARFATAELLLTAYPPQLPDDFAATVVAVVRAEDRLKQLRIRLVGTFSLAAGLLAAVLLAWPRTQLAREVAEVAGSTLEKRLAGATETVRGWTNRAAQSLPELPTVPHVDLAPTLEPAAMALADTGRGIKDGFEPLTSSFQRAASRMWRDLPVN